MEHTEAVFLPPLQHSKKSREDEEQRCSAFAIKTIKVGRKGDPKKTTDILLSCTWLPTFPDESTKAGGKDEVREEEEKKRGEKEEERRKGDERKDMAGRTWGEERTERKGGEETGRGEGREKNRVERGGERRRKREKKGEGREERRKERGEGRGERGEGREGEGQGRGQLNLAPVSNVQRLRKKKKESNHVIFQIQMRNMIKNQNDGRQPAPNF